MCSKYTNATALLYILTPGPTQGHEPQGNPNMNSKVLVYVGIMPSGQLGGQGRRGHKKE